MNAQFDHEDDFSVDATMETKIIDARKKIYTFSRMNFQKPYRQFDFGRVHVNLVFEQTMHIHIDIATLTFKKYLIYKEK